MKDDNLIVKIVKIFFVTILTVLVIMNIVIFAKSKFFPKQVPSIFGYKPFIVLSGSMRGAFNYGDLIVTKEVDTDTLKVGDIISYRNSADFVTTHRIIGLSSVNNKCFITKGDNNNDKDLEEVCSKEIEGKYLFKIVGLGNLVLFIQKPLGFIILMAIIAIICIYIYFSGNEKEIEKD